MVITIIISIQYIVNLVSMVNIESYSCGGWCILTGFVILSVSGTKESKVSVKRERSGKAVSRFDGVSAKFCRLVMLKSAVCSSTILRLLGILDWCSSLGL